LPAPCRATNRLSDVSLAYSGILTQILAIGISGAIPDVPTWFKYFSLLKAFNKVIFLKDLIHLLIIFGSVPLL